MFNYIWPVALVVLSNVFYHIIAKSTPNESNAFLSLTVTYIVAAIVSFVMFLFQGGLHKSIIEEAGKLNWTALVLGVCIIGLELGNILAYRAGWKISNASLIANIVLACILVFVGKFAYMETVTVKQIIGVITCIVGLVLINI